MSLLWGGGAAAFALLMGALAWVGLAESWRGLRDAPPVIIIHTSAASAVGAVFVFLPFAVMLLGTGLSPRWQGRLFGTALAGVTAMLLLPFALALGTKPTLKRMGYQQCEHQMSGRYSGVRWCSGAG